ncbi:MAG: hypothetical protein U0531_00795 [Dehalococcoidia bacterium]
MTGDRADQAPPAAMPPAGPADGALAWAASGLVGGLALTGHAGVAPAERNAVAAGAGARRILALLPGRVLEFLIVRLGFWGKPLLFVGWTRR